MHRDVQSANTLYVRNFSAARACTPLQHRVVSASHRKPYLNPTVVMLMLSEASGKHSSLDELQKKYPYLSIKIEIPLRHLFVNIFKFN